MVDPTPSDYHLTYLRERWDRDRSSRIFLQLAEEYRRRGLHNEALEVLETGLGFHPGYLAAQVALGRCRLEAGQADAAVKVLERVLTQDPTQAVATRLLAESWLQLGDEDRAQQAIDRCRLIGIPPKELVGLEQRMAAARRAARERWAEALEPAAAPADREAPAELPATLSEQLEPEPAPAAEAQTEVPVAEPAPPPLLPASVPAAARPAPAVSPSGPPPAASEVFRLPVAHHRPVLLPLRPGAERRLSGARSQEPFGRMARPRPRREPSAEIFRLVPPPDEHPAVADGTGPAALETAPPAMPATDAPERFLSPEPETPSPSAVAPPSPGPARWWIRPVEPTEPEPPQPESEPAAPPATASPPAAAAREEAKAAPPPAVGPTAPSPLAGTAGVELRPSGTLDVPELRPSDPGTATLGELYLRQGYVREAEEIFKQVLARDADNEAALQGLEAIGRRRAQKLTAAELLAAPEEQGEEEARGLTARKIQLLTRYLRTLRRGAGSDVPGTAQ